MEIIFSHNDDSLREDSIFAYKPNNVLIQQRANFSIAEPEIIIAYSFGCLYTTSIRMHLKSAKNNTLKRNMVNANYLLDLASPIPCGTITCILVRPTCKPTEFKHMM